MERAERGAHHGDRRQALAVMVDERDDFLPDVGVVAAQHPAAVEGVRLLVEQPFGGHRADAEHLHPALLDERRQGADHALAFVLPLVAQAGREEQDRGAEMAEDGHPHLPPQVRRAPQAVFAVHLAAHGTTGPDPRRCFARPAVSSQSGAGWSQSTSSPAGRTFIVVEPVTRPIPPPAPDDRTGLPWRPFVAVLTGLALFTTLQT